MKKMLLIMILIVTSPCMAFAGVTEEGVGILYGGNHAYSFKAPPGWVLDTQSGVNQGLHAVFYQRGQS